MPKEIAGPEVTPGARETQLGEWRIVALKDASFALDGGAMFGVVPRVMWERLTPVNDDHTVPLATTPYLLDNGTHKVLIEPGMGLRWGEKQTSMFHISHDEGHELVTSLRAAGVEPEEITHCLMSHCHWDHIGAACGADGLPVFPKAQHWCPQSERDAALHPDHLRRASYRKEDLQPIIDANLLQTFEGETEILPGLKMVELGGHSDGISLVILETTAGKAAFWADIVPTSNHVHLPFIMAYDMNAALSWEVRTKWIPQSAEEGWINLLYHDLHRPMGRFVVDAKKRYTFAAI